MEFLVSGGVGATYSYNSSTDQSQIGHRSESLGARCKPRDSHPSHVVHHAYIGTESMTLGTSSKYTERIKGRFYRTWLKLSLRRHTDAKQHENTEISNGVPSAYRPNARHLKTKLYINIVGSNIVHSMFEKAFDDTL